MNRHPLARAIIGIGVTLGFGLVLAAPVSAQSDAPAGNNGHIKIDDVLLDDGSENVPHPGCTFVVDFFGYDVGTRSATMSFEGQEPTGGGELLADAFTFEVVSRDSGNELNTSRTVDLSDALVGIEPHPKQGWHVKLTVHVDGAQGADAKHKVFWVSDCSAPALVAAQADADLRAASAEWAAAEQANAVALAASQEAAAAAAAAAAPDQLPRTGGFTGVLTGLALTLIAAGGMLVLRGRATSAI